MTKQSTSKKIAAPVFQLYNTASRSVEPFTPLEEGTVKIYACGLTVYDFTHLGHLRKYTFDDVLVKVLRHAGFAVTHVQNVTDVGHLASDADTGEDKLEKGAKKYGKSVWDIAREFEEYFWKSMQLMNVARPDVSCRATDHIAGQLEMVRELEKKGYAYVIEGDGVYFDTSKFAEYGQMARLNLDMQEPGATVEMIEGKKNHTDFALWKFERPGENRAMVWPSPWHPRSFPGWHIECSAMAREYLGDQLDIHTGGIDHIPVHHTNEIAQAEAATDKKPFVKYWVHHNFLRISGEKMSKSLGNFFTIDDAVARGFEPLALRLLFLTAHYRSEFNFTWETLTGMQKSWLKLKKLVATWKQEANDSWQSVFLSPAALGLQQEFWDALHDDLNTAMAVATVWKVSKSGLSNEEKLVLMADFDQVLSIGIQSWIASDASTPAPDARVQLSSQVNDLLLRRERARAESNWQLSDQLRDELAAQGIIVKDTEKGQEIA